MVTYTHSWKPRNQDAVIATGRMITAIDGCSPISSADGSAERVSDFAATFAENLAAAVSDPDDVRGEIATALRTTQNRCGDHGVTATLALAVWDAENLAVAVIGDSPVVIELAGEHTAVIITDPAYDGHEDAALTRVREALDQGLPASRAYTSARPLLAADRAARNTRGGRWIISDFTPAEDIAARITVRTFPTGSVSRVSACTDGMSRIVELLGALTYPELFDRVQAGAGDELVSIIDELEDDDPEGARLPRFSRRDDMSAAIGVPGTT
ncbi:PP2C family serine/threonine-protein phosphatase [Corynebacterium sp. P7003]|uniref:PP2C family serine/threonine-protein phosphatase n=1 Tax=Corynebacterium pygosceleis TaxID=2800406 RepID=A0ABT3WPH4_9CORY|nr:PP2C family serine/threonine-protein phosphatase [Corynebacterium pygosceleis]MCX7444167.1 PP2C family serine/threonine-protein phosphatase [Corynebacterium pygosceleis]